VVDIVNDGFTVETVYLGFLVQEEIPQIEIQGDILSWVI
jgi:hypothetical protein